MGLPNYFITTLRTALVRNGSETQVDVGSITTFDGEVIDINDFIQLGRWNLTISPQSPSTVEYIKGTTINPVGPNFAGATRGLSATGDSVVTANKKYHPVGAQVLISWGTHDIQQMMDLHSNQTTDGIKIFTSSPQVPSPVLPTDAVSKSYSDSSSSSGAADASTTTKGLSRLSKSPNKTIGTFTVTVASPAVFTLNSHGLTLNDSVRFTTTGALPTGLAINTTYYIIAAGLTTNTFEVSITLGGAAVNTTGTQSGVHTLVKTTPIVLTDNDYRLNPNNYAVDLGANDTYAITLADPPVSYVTGQQFSFKANTANTGAASLNVNSLGAKAIKKDVNVDLATGDILANQIVFVEYDSTNFQIISRTSTQPTVQTFTSSGTYTPSIGLKFAVIEVQGAGAGGTGTTGSGGGGQGGGAGGYAKKILSPTAIGVSQTVTIGAAGTHGISGATGGNGGNTSFGTLIVANGGTGAGAGGTATGGDINIQGGSSSGAPGKGSGGATTTAGIGANSMLGFGGTPNGGTALGYGSGGGGNGSNASSTDGGDGKDGIIIVTEYYN